MAKLRVDIEVTEDQIKELARKSHLLRVVPRKPWSADEYKEHARFAVQRLVDVHLHLERSRV